METSGPPALPGLDPDVNLDPEKNQLLSYETLCYLASCPSLALDRETDLGINPSFRFSTLTTGLLSTAGGSCKPAPKLEESQPAPK